MARQFVIKREDLAEPGLGAHHCRLRYIDHRDGESGLPPFLGSGSPSVSAGDAKREHAGLFILLNSPFVVGFPY